MSYPAGRSAKKGLFGEDPYKINFAGKPSGLTARIGPGPGGETSGPLIKEIYRSTFPSNGAVLTMLSWWIPLVMKPMSSITAQCSRPSFVVHGLAGGNPAGQTRLTGRLITAPLGFRHPSAAFTRGKEPQACRGRQSRSPVGRFAGRSPGYPRGSGEGKVPTWNGVCRSIRPYFKDGFGMAS